MDVPAVPSMALAPLHQSTTARLWIRPFTARDARELRDVVWASREPLSRWMNWPREMTEVEHARRFIASGRDGWTEGRTARLAIVERLTDQIVGSIELDGVDLRRRQAELGYWIRYDRQRRGYATEAARLLLLHGFRTLGLHKVRADVAVGNVGSARVLEKLRFTLEGTLREDRLVGERFADHWRFGLLDREFEATQHALETAPIPGFGRY